MSKISSRSDSYVEVELAIKKKQTKFSSCFSIIKYIWTFSLKTGIHFRVILRFVKILPRLISIRIHNQVLEISHNYFLLACLQIRIFLFKHLNKFRHLEFYFTCILDWVNELDRNDKDHEELEKNITVRLLHLIESSD